MDINGNDKCDKQFQPKLATRLMKLVEPWMPEIKAFEAKRLRDQTKVNYFEDMESSNMSQSSSSFKQKRKRNGRRGNNFKFLKKKTLNNDQVEPSTDINTNNNSSYNYNNYNTDLIIQEPITLSQKNNLKNKFTKRLRYKPKSIVNNIHKDKQMEKEEEKSFDSIKDIEDEYEKDWENISSTEEMRNETLKTIVSAQQLITEYEDKYFQLELSKDKKGYPGNCIPINADIKVFDFQKLAAKQREYAGCLFDVIVIDPPWSLSSGNPSRGVAITYDKLTDDQISDLKINCLQEDGFIFIWTINAKYTFVFELLEKWGYTYCDVINWIKKTRNGKLAKGHGFYLQHTKESCIVGTKGKPAYTYSDLKTDVIFSQRRGQSQKPNELYEKIEQFIPNGYYLELFGRRNNLRDNWVTIGNEI